MYIVIFCNCDNMWNDNESNGGAMKDKIILGIDPGPVKSAYVFLCGMTILKTGYVENGMMLFFVQDSNYDICAVEGVRSFGPKEQIGNTTLITCELAGILYQAARSKGKAAAILYSNTTSADGIRAIRPYFGGKTRDEISQIVKGMFPGQYGDYRKPGVLYIPEIKGKKKKDHKLCAAAVAMVYQGSKQYQKECNK